MRILALLLLHLQFLLPVVLWFVLEARIARLNMWVWGACAILAVELPFWSIGWLSRLLRDVLGTTSEPSRYLSRLTGFGILAACLLIAIFIYTRFLKPRRLEAIGSSLNYVGGWLGTMIFQLFFTALGPWLVIYMQLKSAFPDRQITEVFFQRVSSSAEDAIGVGLLFGLLLLSSVGCLWAGLALSFKKPYAIRLTGYLLALTLLGFFLLISFYSEVNRSAGASMGMNSPATVLWIWNVVWLGYLIRSRRVREVYGQNLWSHEGKKTDIPKV